MMDITKILISYQSTEPFLKLHHRTGPYPQLLHMKYDMVIFKKPYNRDNKGRRRAKSGGSVLSVAEYSKHTS